MSPYVSSKLGQVTLGIFAITGTSLLIANILSLSSSKITGGTPETANNDLSSIPSSQQATTEASKTHQVTDSFASPEYSRSEIPPIQHKKCKVFLASKDQDHKVVSCRDFYDQKPRSLESWYLFNKEQNSLEKIDGLTAKNDTGWKPLEDTDPYWKNKQWQGYRGRTNYRNWGKQTIGVPFELQYAKEDSFKFPFYDYLGFFCKAHKWRKYKGFPFPTARCTQFDLPANQFRNRHINPHLKKAFGEEKEQCFVGAPKDKRREFNWQETDCNSLLTKK